MAGLCECGDESPGSVKDLATWRSMYRHHHSVVKREDGRRKLQLSCLYPRAHRFQETTEVDIRFGTKSESGAQKPCLLDCLIVNGENGVVPRNLPQRSLR
ncbi:hypothetical protein ANN_07403 [Periplaneta americana]|uniref:Uncharacterized protein n=1 Tax=Periplaneta americana TaxID=6978 RepID=A0ABQ8T046_PERAM|nr:hypothetical protein ANN_07403 [Periplaneta americana]